MNIFDRVWGGDLATALTKEEAIAGIAMCACNADGNMSGEEVVRAAQTLMWLNIFKHRDSRHVEKIISKMIDLTKKRGPGTIMQSAQDVLTKNEAAAAYFIAADLVLCDGVFENQEQLYLDHLQKALKLEKELADKILEVAKIKNSI